MDTLLCKNKFTENLTGTIRVDDIAAKTMKTVIKYMYQNNITFDEASDLDVLLAANKYNIVDLVAKCQKYIIMSLSTTNVLDVLAVAKLLPKSFFFENAMDFFVAASVKMSVQGINGWN
jgi:hypothetical protein